MDAKNHACDLRSDTVTRPGEAMRRAMATAEVGDDVFGDDPTVNRLEELAASMLGKEAAMLVPSGTMGNQIALRYATNPGDEALVEESSHMLLYEVGAASMFSGVQLRPVRGCQGHLDLEHAASMIRDPADDHQPRTTFITVENTHNMAGGTAVSIEHLRQVGEFAHSHGLHLHMDGARIFNAAVALGVSVSEVARYPRSVMFCLSKGLGAPIGSMLVADREMIRECRRLRKAFGGGMRQAGVIAAPAIVALETMIDRLADDHRRAHRLAQSISELPGLRVDLDSVQSNMVYVEVDGGPRAAHDLEQKLAASGVLTVALGPRRLRLVTHCDVDDDAIERGIQGFREVLGRHAGNAR